MTREVEIIRKTTAMKQPEPAMKQPEPAMKQPEPAMKPDINPELTPAKMEITLKITEIPKGFQIVKDGWYSFSVNADNQVVSMTVKPKVWNKLTKANEDFPQWIAAITGKMGVRIKGGFILENAAVQVFEKKPKEPEKP